MNQQIINDTAFERASLYQHTANALSDFRSNIAPLVFERIASQPEYHSWTLAGFVALLHVSDKVDGIFAKKREKVLSHISPEERTHLLPEDLQEAIKIGGRKDDKADKALSHAIFSGITLRELQNGHTSYASLIGTTDCGMYLRDVGVGIVRDKAEQEGKKPDARTLGKWKQAVLALTSVVAVSPLADPKETNMLRKPGRISVTAGMLGGAILSSISGIDQIRNIKYTTTR